MSKKITVTQAVRTFSEIIGQVRFQRESFILTKGGKPVAEIRPLPSTGPVRLADLPAVLESLPHLDSKEVESFARDLESSREQINKLKPRDPWES